MTSFALLPQNLGLTAIQPGLPSLPLLPLSQGVFPIVQCISFPLKEEFCKIFGYAENVMLHSLLDKLIILFSLHRPSRPLNELLQFSVSSPHLPPLPALPTKPLHLDKSDIKFGIKIGEVKLSLS